MKLHTWSRRKRALIRLLALVLLVALVLATGSYHILPQQSLGPTEQRSGIAPTEIIHTEWGIGEPMEKDYLMVSVNRDLMLLTSAYFNLARGWGNRGTVGIVIPDDPKRQHHVWKVYNKDETVAWASLFGFVPDGGTAPTFKMGVYDWGRDITEEIAYVGEPVFVTPTPTIPVEGGMLYLEQYLFPFDGADYPEHKELGVHVWEDGEWNDPSGWTVSSRG